MNTISDEKIFSIQLKGALDGASSEDLLSYLESLLEQGYTRFLFNFSFVQFITSNGISTLLKVQNRMKKSPHLSFVFYGLTEEVENVLSLLGIYKKLPIRKSLTDAENYLRLATSESVIRKEEIQEQSETKPAAERIKFYYTGAPKEPVSRLEKISEENTVERKALRSFEKPIMTRTVEVPDMERLLEDKLSLLRREIKETLSTELEKRFTPTNRTETNPTNEAVVGQIPSYIQSKSKKNNDTSFQRIFPCEACGTKLRVFQSGQHRCPNCKTEVYVSATGPTRFIEKLDI